VVKLSSHQVRSPFWIWEVLVIYVCFMMDGKKYIESIMSFPVCNYTQGVSENNIGYVSGLIEGGIPFKAEVFHYKIL